MVFTNIFEEQLALKFQQCEIVERACSHLKPTYKYPKQDNIVGNNFIYQADNRNRRSTLLNLFILGVVNIVALSYINVT